MQINHCFERQCLDRLVSGFDFNICLFPQSALDFHRTSARRHQQQLGSVAIRSSILPNNVRRQTKTADRSINAGTKSSSDRLAQLHAQINQLRRQLGDQLNDDNSDNHDDNYNQTAGPISKRRQVALGSPCLSSKDCTNHNLTNAHCNIGDFTCSCLPQYTQLNATYCLPREYH